MGLWGLRVGCKPHEAKMMLVDDKFGFLGPRFSGSELKPLTWTMANICLFTSSTIAFCGSISIPQPSRWAFAHFGGSSMLKGQRVEAEEQWPRGKVPCHQALGKGSTKPSSGCLPFFFSNKLGFELERGEQSHLARGAFQFFNRRGLRFRVGSLPRASGSRFGRPG